jgi:hypothetical protein
MKLKMASVSMVRNECDIMELFIKINSRIFDDIYIIDHMSSDGTKEIIGALKAQGFPVKYSQLNSSQFNQAETITNLIRQVAQLNLYDYIVPMDADEFLCLESNDISKWISSESFGLILWRTFCPISNEYYAAEAPLYEIFRMRESEPNQFYKIILGNEYAKACQIFSGNHFAENNHFKCEPKILSSYLAHVPIRTCNQLINKAILGSHALRAKSNRFAGEGFHWDLMAKIIRDKDFKIDFEDMAKIASRYAMDENSLPERPSLAMDGPRIGLSTDSIQMKNLSFVNNLKAFDSFMLGIKANPMRLYI